MGMIHIVVETGGCYDDAYERVIGCYTDKAVADTEAAEYHARMRALQISAEKEYIETDFDGDRLPEEEYMRIMNVYYGSFDYGGVVINSYPVNKKLYEGV